MMPNVRLSETVEIQQNQRRQEPAEQRVPLLRGQERVMREVVQNRDYAVERKTADHDQRYDRPPPAMSPKLSGGEQGRAGTEQAFQRGTSRAAASRSEPSAPCLIQLGL